MTTLSREEEWTELDEQFKDLMQKMAAEIPDFYEEPRKGVDYSFLNQDKRSEGQGLMGKIKGIGKLSSFATKIAVIAISILLTGSGIAVWINSEPANALKFQAEKSFYNVKDGIFSGGKGANEEAPDETCITRKFTSMDDLDKAKNFMPDLIIPGYVPEGYLLDELKIEKDNDGRYNAFYTFLKNDKNFYINLFKVDENDSYQVVSDGELIDINGRQMCLWKDDTTDTYGGSCIINDFAIYISGDISREDIIELGKNFK
ncbi:DUF4367 domain-containing protein [Aminipila sp.]|uniref:DUF4367 domain-containing protein n=1 Tax=Aminipila sp. TaxID=2060095 RepID=UPI002898D574|nr:DUF4367 domain-containing protein [Aminipila sp.]